MAWPIRQLYAMLASTAQREKAFPDQLTVPAVQATSVLLVATTRLDVHLERTNHIGNKVTVTLVQLALTARLSVRIALLFVSRK